ncbi:hypothetical protein [Streptomyces yangpuensis]
MLQFFEQTPSISQQGALQGGHFRFAVIGEQRPTCLIEPLG